MVPLREPFWADHADRSSVSRRPRSAFQGHDAAQESLSYEKAKLAGVGSSLFAKEELATFEDRLRSLDTRIEDLRHRISEFDQTTVDRSCFVDALSHVGQLLDGASSAQRRQLVDLMVREARLTEDGRAIEVDLYEGARIWALIPGAKKTEPSRAGDAGRFAESATSLPDAYLSRTTPSGRWRDG